MLIALKTKDGEQSQLTYCTFEKNTQNNHVIKIIKQRVRIGKYSFCLQEIYGIEQKTEGEELETRRGSQRNNGRGASEEGWRKTGKQKSG